MRVDNPTIRIRVFAPPNIDRIRKAIGMSFGGFMRAMIPRANLYGIKPSNNHVRDIINGKRKPSPNYLALFADTLQVPVDEFFEKRRVEV